MLDNSEFYKTLNVLYVETSHSTSKFFSNILLKFFNNVIRVENLNKAITTFSNQCDFKFDIIISDMQLDKGNKGIDFLQIVRKTDENIPFVLTTGVIDSEELLYAIKYRATDFLIKPLSADALLKCLEKICLNRHHEALKEKAKKDLTDIFHVVNEIALVSKTNLNGEITFANKAFCEVTGFGEDELLGKTHDMINDTNHEVLKELDEVIKSGKVWEGKTKNITKEKEEFYLYLTVMPLFDEDTFEIKEFMWISFLATDYEMEHKIFRKKVAQNLNENRRINTQAREYIDDLINKINYYQNIDKNIYEEKSRKDKFISQEKYFKSETKEKEKRLEEIVKVAKVKINEVVETQKKTKVKRDEIAATLDEVVKDFELKNKTIKELTKELKAQKKLVDQLMMKIDYKELQLGMD